METTTWITLHTISSSPTSSWAKQYTVLANTSLEFLTIEMLMSLSKSTLTTFKVETENRIKYEGRLENLSNIFLKIIQQ